MQNENKNKNERLIAEIVGLAEFATIHAEDRSAGQELEFEAKKIQKAGEDDSLLVAFYKYAAHWKGLRDIYFPGKQKEWDQKVKYVRQLCEDVMVERGIIKPSLLHKLFSLLRGPQQ